MQLIDVRVQEADFDVGEELARLRATDKGIGALASFVGVTRDLNDNRRVSTMHLEHYPGMTEQAIVRIIEDAQARWRLLGAIVIHRVGPLEPSEQIVLVAVASAHRGDAFQACEFIMDFLKTKAPFWKRESTPQGERWVAAKTSDDTAADRWAATESTGD